MAALKHSRGARSHARSANRPRTHPKTSITTLKGAVKVPDTPGLPPDLLEWLDDLRRALSLAVSVVNVCYATLEEQRTGRDLDVADVLRQCVSNRLFEQIQWIERWISRGPAS